MGIYVLLLGGASGCCSRGGTGRSRNLLFRKGFWSFCPEGFGRGGGGGGSNGDKDEVTSQRASCPGFARSGGQRLWGAGRGARLALLRPAAPLLLQPGRSGQPQPLAPCSAPLGPGLAGVLGRGSCQSFLLMQKCAEKPQRQRALPGSHRLAAEPKGREGPRSRAVLRTTPPNDPGPFAGILKYCRALLF